MVKAAKISSGTTKLSEAGTAFRVDFAARLAFLLGLFDSRSAASEVAGVTAEQLSRYLAGAHGKGGTAKVPFDVISRLALKKGISLDWLARGEGPREIGMPVGGDYIHIPVYDARASSGFGTFFSDDNIIQHMAIARTLLKGATVQEGRLAILFNAGRSNEPDLNDGDALIVDRSVERIVDDAYYVFDRDGSLLVKMIERDVRGGITLRSGSAAFTATPLSKEEAEHIRVLARVIWAGGLV